MEAEEEPNGSGKERKARLEKSSRDYMLAIIKGVVNVGVVLPLKSWQLCLSFKLDVHRHPQLKEYRSLWFASLILFINNLYLVFKPVRRGGSGGFT